MTLITTLGQCWFCFQFIHIHQHGVLVTQILSFEPLNLRTKGGFILICKHLRKRWQQERNKKNWFSISCKKEKTSVLSHPKKLPTITLKVKKTLPSFISTGLIPRSKTLLGRTLRNPWGAPTRVPMGTQAKQFMGRGSFKLVQGGRPATEHGRRSLTNQGTLLLARRLFETSGWRFQICVCCRFFWGGFFFSKP